MTTISTATRQYDIPVDAEKLMKEGNSFGQLIRAVAAKEMKKSIEDLTTEDMNEFLKNADHSNNRDKSYTYGDLQVHINAKYNITNNAKEKDLYYSTLRALSFGDCYCDPTKTIKAALK